jgi:predicted nucleic acid-binding protein
MEWVRKLYGSVVGLDSAPLIYFVELHPAYLPLVDPFFAAIESGNIQAVTSSLTLTEVLVHPLRRGNAALARQYSEILLTSSNLLTVPVSTDVAAEGARIRALHGLRTPDALQLAAATLGHASAFLTNDRSFDRIPGIRTIVLDDLLAAIRP